MFDILDRPVCHYTGTWCQYEGTACTCTQPGFVGTPPRWPVRDLRAELDKCEGLDEADKQALLAIAFAGSKHATNLRAAMSASKEPTRAAAAVADERERT